jgi:ATPase subunit of ABC transporter with duplicated ATPase domains
MARRALIASHDRELLTQMPRILELTSAALRSYGGNYADYQQQRELEQQAARAALEHAVTERRRTRARMQRARCLPAALGADAAYYRYAKYRFI